MRTPPTPIPFPYTTLFRSKFSSACSALTIWSFSTSRRRSATSDIVGSRLISIRALITRSICFNHRVSRLVTSVIASPERPRSEEHTSELQSHSDLVCRLLLDAHTTDTYTLSLHDALPI